MYRYDLIDALKIPRICTMDDADKQAQKEALSRIDCGLDALSQASNPINRALRAGNLAGDDMTGVTTAIAAAMKKLRNQRLELLRHCEPAIQKTA